MTEPNPFELLELATPYALNAISDSERVAIDRQLAAAPATVAGAFNDEVRAVRETMAVISAATAAGTASSTSAKQPAFQPSAIESHPPSRRSNFSELLAKPKMVYWMNMLPATFSTRC